MQKILILSVLALTVINYASAQSFSPDKYRRELNSEVDSLIADTNLLIPYRSLDLLFQEKASSYLTNGSDVSLFSNYVILNTDDDRLTFGHNFPLQLKKNKDKKFAIRNLLSTSFIADIDEGFAPLFSKEEFSKKMGVNLKYTHLFRGILWFDGKSNKQKRPYSIGGKELNEQEKFDLYVRGLEAEILYQMKQDSIELEGKLAMVRGTKDEIVKAKNEIGKTYFKKKKYIENYYKTIKDDLSIGDHYNRMFYNWFSLEAYTPITASEYSVADTSDMMLTNAADIKFRPFEAKINYSLLYQTSSSGNMFINLYEKSYLNNNIRAEEIEESTIADYTNIGSTDTLALLPINTRSAYRILYSSFWSHQIGGRITYYFPKVDRKKRVLKLLENKGFFISVDKTFGEFNPFNLSFGIPLTFTGEKADSPINLEFKITFTDLADNVAPSRTAYEKLVWGFSTSVPFGNLMK
jgi:hypothetical protein